MSERRTEDRTRYRYGKCLNENCDKCKSKEVLEIPSRKEFVCPECGSKLFECAPPKKSNKTPLIAGIIAGVAILAGAGIWMVCGSSEKTEIPVEGPHVPPIDSLNNGSGPVVDPGSEPQDTIDAKAWQNTNTPTPSPAPTPAPAPKTSEHKLGYGVWTGGWKNGQPHDTHGTMKYTESHLIDSRDPKKRIAEPGDYIIGEWSEGKLVQGVWYDSSNTVKGSILIGQ